MWTEHRADTVRTSMIAQAEECTNLVREQYPADEKDYFGDVQLTVELHSASIRIADVLLGMMRTLKGP